MGALLLPLCLPADEEHSDSLRHFKSAPSRLFTQNGLRLRPRRFFKPFKSEAEEFTAASPIDCVKHFESAPSRVFEKSKSEAEALNSAFESHRRAHDLMLTLETH